VHNDTFLAGYAVLAGERQAGFGTPKQGAMAGIVYLPVGPEQWSAVA